MGIRFIKRADGGRSTVAALVLITLGITLAGTAAGADLRLAVGGFVGGGGRSADGNLTLIGTIGEPAAGSSSGGTLSLSGGVLAGGGDPTRIFVDGFENGSVASWSASQ